MGVDLKSIVEALIFVSETPLSLAQLAQVLEDQEKPAIQAAIAQLAREYQGLGRAFSLVEVAGGWAFRTRPELAFWLRRLKREQATKLSRAALETLAIIAYKQPVMKAEIERLRGVEVGGVLRVLMEKDLVKVVGRKDLPGRPLVYGTTRRFLEVFDLKDLKDLPTMEEMEALADEPQGLSQAPPEEEEDMFTRMAALRAQGEAAQDQDGGPSAGPSAGPDSEAVQGDEADPLGLAPAFPDPEDDGSPQAA